MTERIFLEMKNVDGSFETAGHMYLVKRDVQPDQDGLPFNLYTLNDRVIRGSFGIPNLGAGESALFGSLDDYGRDDSPLTRHSVDITDLVGGVSKWAELAGYASDINNAHFSYELPGGPHLANSNAVILAVLEMAGLDVRDLDINGVKTDVGPRYVDSFFNSGAPGGSSASGTLLASSAETSAENLTRDITILGRDNVSDTIIDTKLNEAIYGEQEKNGDSINDIVKFSKFDAVDLTISKIDFGLQLSSRATGTDKLFGIERIELSDGADHLRISSTFVNSPKTIVDAGTQSFGQRDILDFSAMKDGVTLKQAGDAVFMSRGLVDDALSDGGVQFKNFEQIDLAAAADTAKITSIGDLNGVREINAGGGIDTVDFSGSDSAITIESGRIAGPGTLLKNFEKIMGTSAGDSISYSNDKTKIEIHGGGGMDDIKTGDGDDLLDGGDDQDQLQGGGGFDRYFVTNRDTVTDSDGHGSITAASGILSGGERDGEAGAFTGAGGDKYLWDGEGSGSGDLTIITHLGEHVTVTDFHNGDLGIVLKENPDPNKPKPFPGNPFGHQPISPLVLDLDGNGIGLSSTASGAHFDFGGDHFREATGWVNPGDGLLVYDANHDGAISDSTELFGNAMTEGFDVLSYYDGRTGGNYYSDPTGGAVNAANANGVIDINDAIYSQLQIWRDLNQDGIAQSNELMSLADAGITRIHLNHTAPDAATEVNAEITGNRISQVATFDRQDGSSSSIGDAWFAVDQSDTIYDGPSAPGLDYWPDLHGYGSFDQLHNVLSENAGLKTEFRAFIDKVQDQSISSLMPQFEKLTYKWAGIPEDYSVNRGEFINARVLAFLEDAYGQEFHQLQGLNEGTNSPGPNTAGVLDSIFDNAIASYFVKFLAQVPGFTANVGDEGGNTYVSKYSPLAAALHYNPVDDSIQFDAPALASALASLDLTDPAAVQNALDIFGALTVLEAYELQSNAQFYGALREALVSAGATKLIPLIDSFRIYDSSDTYVQTPTDGISDYLMRSFNFENFGQYTIVDAGATVEHRQTGHSSYVSDLFYVRSGLGTITFQPERGSVQDKIILSSDFDTAPYTIEEDVQSGDVRLVFATLGTTILLQSYLDAHADNFSQDWSTGANLVRTVGQTIYFANGTVLQPTDIAELVVHGTDGNDHLKGIWLNQTIDGKGGDDVIVGGGYDNTIIGGTGDDQLSGNGSLGVFVFNVGDGHDTISQAAGSTLQLNGILLSDIHLTRGESGDLLITFSAHPNDSINIVNEFGAPSIAKVVFGDGTVWSLDDIQTHLVLQNTTDGDDVIVGFNGSDMLAGGRGNDILQGGPSPFGAGDTYIYQRGDGNDTIIPSSINAEDTLKLVGIRSDQVSVTRSGSDAILTFSVPEGGSITLQEQFGPNGFHGLEKVVFSDGVVWSQRDFVTHSEPSTDTPTVVGTTGDDVLNGTAGNDGIAGLGGDDILRGGFGSDTYFFGIGSGHDIIEDNGSNDYLNVDVVKLSLLPSDVELTRGATDVVIKIIATGETLTLANFFFGDVSTDHQSSASIEHLEFSDGTVWDVPQITANAWIRGTDGDDSIVGTRDADTIAGGAGDDQMSGYRGSDTYIVAAGGGHDKIVEYTEAIDPFVAGSSDTVRFIDSTIDDLEFRKVRDSETHDLDLVVARKDGSASVAFDLSFGLAVENIQFSDGTVHSLQDFLDQAQFVGTDASEVVVGVSTDDTIVGRKGNDVLEGGSGSDTYIWSRGDGNDVIMESSEPNDSDTLHLSGIDPSLVRLERVAQDNGFDDPFYQLVVHILPLQATDAFETITVDHEFDLNSPGGGIEFITFDNGVVWDRAHFAALAPLVGTSSADIISGSELADVITGGLGDDDLIGGAGSDTYVWNVGDGNDSIFEHDGRPGNFDTLRLHGVDPSDVSLEANNQFESPDVLIHINSTGEVIRLSNQLDNANSGIDQIVFDNGDIWDPRTVDEGGSEDGILVGTSGNDVLHGGIEIFEIDGLDGDDTIIGSDDADETINGGHGNDILSGGDGYDVFIIQGGDGNDVIDGGTGGNELDVFNYEGSVTVNLATGLLSGDDIGITSVQNIDNVFTDSGDDFLIGSDAGDFLSAGNGDDLIQGGLGDDSMEGDSGNDTYVYQLGDGTDGIQDEGSASDRDILLLGNGIQADQVTVTDDGDEGVILGFSDGGSIDLVSEFRELIAGIIDNAVEEVHFADSTVWTKDDLAALLNGSFSGAGSTHTLNISVEHEGAGRAGSSLARALTSDANANIVTSAAGSDKLSGTAGNDVFVFHAGFGKDAITDFAAGPAAGDVIRVDASLFSNFAAIQAHAQQVGSDTVIAYDANNTITLSGVALAQLHSNDFHFV